jgi:chromosome segregation ATPase
VARKDPELQAKLDAAEVREEELLSEIRELNKQLKQAKRDRDDVRSLVKAEDELAALKRQIVEEEIKSARIQEDHDREKREIEHKVGLVKLTQTVELEAAKRDASLTAREENLETSKAQFEEQMKFITDRMTKEVEAQSKLMGKILDRLPTVNVNKEITTKS